MHAYPARLLPHIPHFVLRAELCDPGGLVLDPFCGSGTVLVEAILTGHRVAGADANPLARLITEAKVSAYRKDRLARSARRLLARLGSHNLKTAPDVINVDYWYSRRIQNQLRQVLAAIEATRDAVLRNLYFVAFSSILRDVSYADPRLSVPVRLRADQYDTKHWLFDKTKSRLASLKHIDARTHFSQRLNAIVARAVAKVPRAPQRGLPILEDARALSTIRSGTVDLVITSPPYVGAQKYIRASGLNLTWLRLCRSTSLRSLEDLNIGREHFPAAQYDLPLKTGVLAADRQLKRLRQHNPLRAHIAAKYLIEMRQAIREMKRTLRVDGYAVLVIGAGHVCGEPFDTPSFITQIATDEGFLLEAHLVDKIRSRALMTKRNRTAGQIDTESILFLVKPR
jgi:DNA modification methylase